VLVAVTPVFAQSSIRAPAAQDDAPFVEFLRREDPATAERYLALRNARDAAIAELQQAQARYNGGGPALRPVSLPPLRQARQRYVETSLALLEFLDARDRATLQRLDAAAERLKGDARRLNEALEERAHTRAEIQKNFGGD
jgi:hypothetical protein